MSKTSWRLRLVLAVGIAAVLGPLGATIAAVVDSRPVSVRAKDWVVAHSSSLPSTIEAIQQYPIAYRRAIFSALTPAVRSALWRQQLTHFLQTAMLTVEQRAFVEKFIQLADEKAYSQVSATTGPLTNVCRDIARLFPEEQRSVFGVLGSTTDVNEGLISEAGWIRLTERFRQSYIVQAAGKSVGRQVPWCTCNVGPYNCSCGSCGVPQAGCDTTDWGCGCGWLYQCNGQCIAPSPSEWQGGR